MCHTLLQHYIHCRHSNITFYPCVPYLSKHSSHSPLHPNYIQPHPEALHCRGILRSDCSDGRTPRHAGSGEEMEVYGLGRPPPPTYSVSGAEAGSGDGVDGEGDPKWLASEWRDHSKPLGVAHSYHRLCPACVELKVKRKEAAKRKSPEAEERRSTMRDAWQRAAGSGALAEDGDGDGGVEWRDWERRNAVGGEVGIIGDGRPVGSAQQQVVISMALGHDAETRLPVTEAALTPPADRIAVPADLVSRDAIQALDRMQADLQAFQNRWSQLQAQGELAEEARHWEQRVSDAMRRGVAMPIPPTPQTLSQRMPWLSSGLSVQSSQHQRTASHNPSPSNRSRGLSRLATSGRAQPSTRRASTGAMGIVPDVVARGRMWNAARRWRWDHENGEHREQMGSALPGIAHRFPSSTNVEARAPEETSLDATRRLRRADDLRHIRPIVATASRQLSESTAGGPIVRRTAPLRTDGYRQVEPGTPTEQAIADRFMWPRLFHQTDPELNSNRHPITSEPYAWADDGSERTQALGILYQLLEHYQQAGYTFGGMATSAVSFLVPWYRRNTYTEVDAANAAFQHMRYVGQWGDRYGRVRFFELVGRHARASEDELANAIVRAMAQTEQGLAPRAGSAQDSEGVTQDEGRAQVQTQQGQDSQVVAQNARARAADANAETDHHDEGADEDSDSTRSRSADEGMTPHERSGISADLAFDNLINVSVPASEQILRRAAADISTWESDNMEINRAMFRHFWHHSTVEQFDELTVQRAALRSILGTEEGQQALRLVTATQSNSTDVLRYRDRHTLTARRVSTAGSGTGQLEIVSPSGAALRILWDDLTSTATTTSRRRLITTDILGLVNAEMSGLRAALSNIRDHELSFRPRPYDQMEPNSERVGPIASLNDDSDDSMPSLSPTETEYMGILTPQQQSVARVVEQENTERQERQQELPTFSITPPESNPQREAVLAAPARSSPSAQLLLSHHDNGDWANAAAKRQVRDCLDHPSSDVLARIWPMVCNDAMHGRSAEHKHSAENLMSSTQHHRRNWSPAHGRRPYPYNDAREHLTSNTSEVLVEFSRCGHMNAVFVEILDESADSVRSSCGCHGFDHCLTRHRRARSAQMCLVCQFESLMKRELLQTEQIRELTAWFQRHVRMLSNHRDVALWPFAAQDFYRSVQEWR